VIGVIVASIALFFVCDFFEKAFLGCSPG